MRKRAEMQGKLLGLRIQQAFKELSAAAESGNVEKAVQLIKDYTKEISIEPNILLGTLHCAAKFGHLDLLKAILEHELVTKKNIINVNSTEQTGITALGIASEHGHLKVVEYLLKIPGIKVNASNVNGLTALMVACLLGHVNIVRALIDAKSDLDLRNKVKASAMHFAVESKNRDIVQMLTASKASIHFKDKEGFTPFQHASDRGSLEIMKILKDAGADVECRDNMNETCLIRAAKIGDIATASLLLTLDADINAAGRHLITPNLPCNCKKAG